MERYKKVTLEAYEKNAIEYMERTSDYLQRVPTAQATFGAFCALLNGPRILDLGCGPGRDLAYFSERGCRPIGADISEEMLVLVRQRGLEGVRMDFEYLGFQDRSLDGVWAFHSLMHSPKYKMRHILRDIFRILKPGAPFLIALMEGKGNEWRKSSRWGEGPPRYFAFYQEQELRKLLERAGFYVVGILRPEPRWLNILAVRPAEK